MEFCPLILGRITDAYSVIEAIDTEIRKVEQYHPPMKKNDKFCEMRGIA